MNIIGECEIEKNDKEKASIATVLGILLCLSVVATHAQDAGSKFDVTGLYSYQTHSISNPECGGGIFNCIDPGNQGGILAVVANLSRHVGLEANLGYHGGTHTINALTETNFQSTVRQQDGIFTYLAGPKITEPVGNFELFTHFLAGGMHVHEGAVETVPCFDCSNPVTVSNAFFRGTIFGMEVGGGVDWVHNKLAIRLLEVDYVHGAGHLSGRCTSTPFNTGCPAETLSGQATVNDVQIGLGVTLRLGKE